MRFAALHIKINVSLVQNIPLYWLILQGIGVTSTIASPHPTRTKAGHLLNGVGRGRGPTETMETEEEEEECAALEIPITEATPSSVHHHQHHHFFSDSRGRECSPQHMQELQNASQFPMSGDLPSLDPGLPSPSLGFDLSTCSEVNLAWNHLLGSGIYVLKLVLCWFSSNSRHCTCCSICMYNMTIIMLRNVCKDKCRFSSVPMHWAVINVTPLTCITDATQPKV